MIHQARALALLGVASLASFACRQPINLVPATPTAPPPPETTPATPAPPKPLPTPPRAAQAPPAECSDYRREAVACTSGSAPLADLDRALAMADAKSRDRALASLGSCEHFPAGVILVLRAELAPTACADVVVGEVLPIGVAPELGQTLEALVHAAHLNRLVVKAPRLNPPFSKQQFADFSSTVLNDWVVTQAQAVYKIAQQGVKFNGYARGVVAVEAGLADMRFVGVVRELPLPEEMANDDELEEAYYSELDVALTPWKDRGRDAALLGLRDFAEAGVLVDSRVAAARRLLSELYGGRRIDRLDGLLLPELPALQPSGVEQRLATQLPTIVLPYVLPDLDASQPGTLRALLERGLPPAMRADLESRSLSSEAAFVLARALVMLGQRYWRSADFAAAARLLRSVEGSAPAAELVRGLAEALVGGPRDAAEMMLRGPRLPPGVGNVAALDRLARAKGPLAAYAAFNAAYLLELVPPAGDPAFWLDLERRYLEAARALDDSEAKARALSSARAARDTALATRN